MLITSISEKNEFAFDAAIGELWKERTQNEIFLGLVDDDDCAAGAAVLERTGTELAIRFFVIADEFRGRGYGRFFLEHILQDFNNSLVDLISCCLFETEENENAFLAFLKHMGFDAEPVEGRRSVYNLYDVLSVAPFSKSALEKDEKVIPGRAVKEDTAAEVYALEEAIAEGGMVFDAEQMLSEDNVLGGILMKGDRIDSMLGILPFLDGIRIESVYTGSNTLSGVTKLFDHAVKVLRSKEDIPERLYIDSVSSVMMRFEDKLLKDKGVAPEKQLNAIMAVKQLG